MTPTREVYWNIEGVWLMYALLVPTLAVFAYGMYRHFRNWSLGQGGWQILLDRPWERLKGVVRYALAQTRLLQDRYSGIFHLLFFWGFVFLFIGTVVVAIHEDLKIPIMQGPFYLWFQSLTLDVFGALATIGILMALIKRYGLRPRRLKATEGFDDWFLLVQIFLILVTGFMLEGLRIAATNDPWGAWSPVGLATGRFLSAVGFGTPAVQEALHRFLWWFHLAIVFVFVAYIPYSKLLHLFTSPLAVYTRSLEPKGALVGINLEELEEGMTLGVRDLRGFDTKDLIDLDACTECGRCQEVCPAYAVGKPLNPKMLILDMQSQMRQIGPGLAAAAGAEGLETVPTVSTLQGLGALTEVQEQPIKIVGNAIDEETLWACTTCMACMEACPVFIEHVPKIVDLRRFEVMEEAKMPDGAAEAITGIENRGHPFRGAQASRTDWYQDLPFVQEMSQKGEAEYLFWVGCAAAFNERSQKIARSLATILHEAGVDFAVLGNEETCTGDPARRMGNEYLFEMQARQNIATFEGYGVKKIITLCPHCFNTFKNEYTAFDGHYEVVHHSEFIEELIAEGRIELRPEAKGRITFHDPCYLGRYNDIYDAPRNLLTAVGYRPVEMERSREKSFCCGAGGGRYFMEDEPGQRVNHERARQAVETGADIVGTGCPYCQLMLEDGLAAHQPEGRQVTTKDIAEIVAENMVRQREA